MVVKAHAIAFYAIIISINLKFLSLNPVPDVFMILTQRSMSLTVINFEKRHSLKSTFHGRWL